MSKASGVIVAKAKAMHGERLKQEQYEELVRKRSVSEIAGFLKNETSYADALKDVRENNVHRGQLENLLRRDMFQRTLKLYRYADAAQRKIYQIHLEQIEIDLILSRIRVLISQNFEDAIAELPVFLKDYISFPLLQLGKVHTFDELLNVLKKTSYFQVLQPYRVAKGKESEIDYTTIETKLHELYYTHVFTTIDASMKGKNKKNIKEFFTTELDLSNITKIYRLKKFFNAREDVIRDSLLYVEGYSPMVNMEELIAQKSAADVLKKLKDSRYSITKEAGDDEYIEHQTEKIMFDLAKKNFCYSQNAPLVYNSYHVLLMRELENLTNIIEGIRYQVSAEDILKELIYES